MNIQLPTGKTVHVSLIEFLSIEDDQMDIFYQELVADDPGEFLESPFFPLKAQKDIQIEEVDDDQNSI